MVTTLCLFTCAVTAAQPVDRSDWLLVPRLSRGQELVYRGSFAEEAFGKGVHYAPRSYRLESRVFVLDTPPQGADVALFTVLQLRGARPEGDTPRAPSGPGSVRLELARIDLQGKVAAEPAVPLAVPLEGPATLEHGAFVEVPRGRVALNQTWETVDPGQPARSWKVAGTEVLNGTNCLKLVGVQQSDDWDQPRADRTAWRRTDTVWVAARLGLAYRVERVIERREPLRREPTHRSTTRYELESNIQYPGQLFEDRRREIQQARGFFQTAAPLLPKAGQVGPQPFDALLAKITFHLDNQPATPYREAILQCKRRVEAARRGEAPPSAVPTALPAVVSIATPGQVAPDSVVLDLAGKDSARLSRWLGRPLLLVFYNPTAASAEEVLRFAQSVHDTYREAVTVLTLAMSEDAEGIGKQRADLKLTVPVWSGKGLRVTYAVEATPKLMVLDADRVLRGSYVGWGRETPDEVTEELARWLRRLDRPAGQPVKRDKD